MISDALVAAFRATTYRVETEEGWFDLRIGAINPAFDEYLRRRRVSNWGVLTAHNPGAERADSENRRRQVDLMEALRASAMAFMNANNVADGGEWPDEPGFLVLDAGKEEMIELASRFSQLAFVFGKTGSEPILVWV